jgi:phosphate transport system permease protein
VTDTTRQPGTVEPVVDPLAHARTGVEDGQPSAFSRPVQGDPLLETPAAADPTRSPVRDEAAPHSPVPVVEHHAPGQRRQARHHQPYR